MKGFATMVLLALLSGCAASVPMANLEQDTKAKDFIPLPGMGSLYIYRNEFDPGLAFFSSDVSVNRTVIGKIANKTYFRLNLWPGKYQVESYGDNVVQMPVIIDAGKNHFVWQKVKRGAYVAETPLVRVSEEVGRANVMESKLIATEVSGGKLISFDALEASTKAVYEESASQKLRELQSLRDDGLITEDEFQQTKRQLLENF